LTEYFAYDDDYIYYAFSIKMTDNKQVQFQFTNQLNYKDLAEFNATHYSRNVIKFKVNDDNSISEKSVAPRVDCTTPLWDKDVFVKATRNTGTYINTYEVKISREYFKENNIDDTKLGYIVYFGLDSAEKEMWHYWIVPDAAKQALGVYPVWTYNYVFFNVPVETKSTASIRISSTETGLRFKTVIDKTFLNDLINKYGAANVSVGTLITPADILGTNQLTHNFGTVNVDYIDIPATVNDPFESDSTTNTYAGSITSIREGNLDRNFVGVGYIKVTVAGSAPIYYYSDVVCTRNVSFVASMAYTDVQETQDGEYLYKVSSNDKYGNSYSPYTAPQRVIIKSLIRRTGIKDPFDYDIF